MQSLKELYKIGCGPSSSHTMGPRKAAEQFNLAYPQAESFRVTLFGSLAATGKGHLTDYTLTEAFDLGYLTAEDIAAIAEMHNHQ